MTKLAIHPLTADRWNDFVALFETDSICRMCWCMHPRMPPAIREELPQGDARKSAMKKLVAKGPPPGLLAYRDGEAVGWLAIAPRLQTPQWNIGRKSSAVENPEDADDPSVWGASCFFVRRDARGVGVTTALLDAGIAYAKKSGAQRIEAAPMDHTEKRSATGLFVGPKRVFDRAGFTRVLERKEGRPLVRLHVGKQPAAKKTAAKKAPVKKTPARKAT